MIATAVAPTVRAGELPLGEGVRCRTSTHLRKTPPPGGKERSVAPSRVSGTQSVNDPLNLGLGLCLDGVLNRARASGRVGWDSDREGADRQGSHDAGDNFLHGHNVSPWKGYLQRVSKK